MYYKNYSAWMMICILAVFYMAISISCKTVEKNIASVEQDIYSIQLESSGYSDIKRMYSVDSLSENKSFFKSETLQLTDIHFTGILKKAVLNTANDGRYIVYEIQSPTITLKLNDLAVETNKLTLELTKPFFIHEDKYGKIIFLEFDSLNSNVASNFQKEIISQLQFVKPVLLDTAWQIQEENARGVYLAKYFLEKKDTTKRVYKKEVNKYESINARQKKQKADIDTEGDFEIDNSGVLKNATISVAEITLFNKDTVSALASRIQIDYKHSNILSGDSVKLLQELSHSKNYKNKKPLNTSSSDEEILQSAYTATLANNTWQSLLEEIKKAGAYTPEQKKELVLKLRSLFYLQPENCIKAAAELFTAKEKSEVFQLLTNALAITENENATDALAELIVKRKKEPELIVTLFPPLATTTTPTRKAANKIMEIAFPVGINDTSFIASTAQLTVSAMARGLQKKDSVFAEELITEILKRTMTETDIFQKIFIWGNIGSNKVFPLLQQIIKDPVASDDAKSEAIGALKFIPSKEVDRLLAALLIEKNKKFQSAAEQVIDFRKEN